MAILPGYTPAMPQRWRFPPGPRHVDDGRIRHADGCRGGAWPRCRRSRLCHLRFIADAESRRSSAGLVAVIALPVPTVSDRKHFALGDGIIELHADDGRMRFAINVDGAARSGLHLSSRLPGPAKIVRGLNVR
jgi:hypothetical protein